MPSCSLREIAGKTPRAVCDCDVLSSVTFCHSCMTCIVYIFTSKQKENFSYQKRKMCAVGKVSVILNFKKKIISSISMQTSARRTMGTCSMYDESAAIFAKDIGLRQIFLLDRVADLARTI